ncbi:MAG: hypothetical protein EOP38_16560 [Rubrivivax sp.]|nr:MAG: hypothetical protein EOP38_16560 [Rubrivivax sp.]
MSRRTFKPSLGASPASILVACLACSAAHAAEVANVPDSLKARLSTSSAGLTEQFGVTGRLVRLQGRFQSLSVVETQADGQATVKCLSPGPQAVKALQAIEGAPPPNPQDSPTANR